MKKYIRLNITTEGQTEHRFVKDVLFKHLQPLHIYCEVRSVLTSKEYKKRGGMTSYKRAKSDIEQWMSNDNKSEARFTTMFDYYALPNDFPGFAEAQKLNDPYDKVRCIEDAVKADFNDNRFFPYIQLHEFESLLFADLSVLLLEYEDKRNQIEQLKQQLSQSPSNNNPELVNDKRKTSPSHRIIDLIPEYQKVNSGSLITDLVGIEKLRKSCLHFNEWLTKLEQL
jgi:hypothetical protein